ncbi:MAG TPA: hypothetical protein VF103_04290 [Polyangiaceae bacterium]
MKRFISASALLLFGVASACGKDYDGLALKEHASGGSPARGGSGNSGGSSGSGGHAQGGTTSTGGIATSGTGGRIVEPPGRSVTTFFHGIVDAERITFCLARHGDGEPELTGRPRPTGGLAYGTSLALELDFGEDAVLPYVIAGELDLVQGLDCEAAIAKANDEMRAVARAELGAGGASGAGGEAGGGGEGGQGEPVAPRLRVIALPEVPAGTLSAGYSMLYAAVGCIGGPAFTSEVEEDACGEGYSPTKPTASAVLVQLSRKVAFDKLSLQALHASLAMPTLTVFSTPPDTAVRASVMVTFDLARGVIAPRSPTTELSVDDYGVTIPEWKAEAVRDSSTYASELWVDVLERAGLDALEPTHGYTLVVVGPRGQLGTAGFWNQPAIGVVDNNPEP